jgi:hypothetical protein
MKAAKLCFVCFYGHCALECWLRQQAQAKLALLLQLMILKNAVEPLMNTYFRERLTSYDYPFDHHFVGEPTSHTMFYPCLSVAKEGV